MGERFPVPLGGVSRRVHGLRRELIDRRRSALAAALRADEMGEKEFAASLRGKASAYDEARHMLDALDRGYRLPRRNKVA